MTSAALQSNLELDHQGCFLDPLSPKSLERRGNGEPQECPSKQSGRRPSLAYEPSPHEPHFLVAILLAWLQLSEARTRERVTPLQHVWLLGFCTILRTLLVA